MQSSKQSLETLDVSDRLRLLMATHKLTVSELAERAGVSKSAMEKYLAGPSSPRATALASICLSMGVSADWLLLGHDDDLYRVQSMALSVIISMLDDLKREGALNEQFEALPFGSKQWREFARELAFEHAAEIRNAVATKREKDASELLVRVVGGVCSDLQTGKLAHPDEDS